MRTLHTRDPKDRPYNVGAIRRVPLAFCRYCLGEHWRDASGTRRLVAPCLVLFAFMVSPAQAAIREISSKHLTLYTDLPAGAEIDALPVLFDQAVPQWCAYFGIDDNQRVAAWRMRGYLMQARAHFAADGLLPADLPNFLNGYTRGDQLWLYNQTSDYYRRHLLLHEGTHAFMAEIRRLVGPAWMNEGMAELLATHRLEDGRLMLG